MESMDDRAFPHQQRMVRRRLMEVQSGAEVRRLHIVYFLSRKGFTEHPHLIRVHHLSNNGVRLQDIKRWLGELRGKDMPQSFAWSYKRRYKSGYVWQDLLDDDLVTPISDNEYVLKGSEISPTTNNTEIPMQKDQSSSDTSMNVSTKLSSKIIESSPTFGSATSTLTDIDSGHKLEPDKNISDTINQLEANSSTHPATVMISNKKINKKNKIRRAKKFDEKSISTTTGVASLDKPRFAMSFRNLINCGGVDTKDSAVVTTHDKHNRPFLHMCKTEKLGGSDDQMIFGKARRTQHQWSNNKSCDGAKDSTKRKGQCREERATCAAYKPLNGPNCAQCGKPFKPEKLHAHMKSCKGMKILAKASNHAIFSAVAENKSQKSAASRNRDSHQFLSIS